MTLLAVDAGSSHCKAGLFDLDGSARRIASRATPVERGADGGAAIDPDALWQAVAAVMGEAAGGEPVAAVGIASMAETGLLVDRRSFRPRSPLVPWFDPAAAPQAERLAGEAGGDPSAIFRRSGLRASYKCGLAKILWLREREPGITDAALWLSTADFIALKLTGWPATGPTLAARTLAYDIEAGGWDGDWLSRFGLDGGLFPPVLTSGVPLGQTTAEARQATGGRLPEGVPVSICGHDHVVASLAAGSGAVFDSLGTAEALVGSLPQRPLTAADYASGLVFGPHVTPGRLFWMGALSASGGSLDWLRGLLADPPLSYDGLAKLVAEAGPDPVDLVYLPYLLGAQAPQPDPVARAGLVGLTAAHGRAGLAKAVLQGVAYEIASILDAAEAATGSPIRSVVSAGGGARVPGWLQMRADVTGRPVAASPHDEATLFGTAVLAGAGAGLYGGATQAEGLEAAEAAGRGPGPARALQPDPARHEAHRRLREVYGALQGPLRAASAALGWQRQYS